MKYNHRYLLGLMAFTTALLLSCSTQQELTQNLRRPASYGTESKDVFVGWNDHTQVLASDSLYLLSSGTTSGVVTAKVDPHAAVALEVFDEFGKSFAKIGPKLGQVSLNLALPSKGRFRVSFQGALTTSRDVKLSTQCLGTCPRVSNEELHSILNDVTEQ